MQLTIGEVYRVLYRGFSYSLDGKTFRVTEDYGSWTFAESGYGQLHFEDGFGARLSIPKATYALTPAQQWDLEHQSNDINQDGRH